MQHVLISGAGIAGTAAAHWFHRLGWRVTVVERAATLRPGGQAVDFRGDIHRTVLAGMGVADEVAAHRTGGTDWRLIHASGRIRGVVPAEFLGGDIEILRGDLARILAARTLDTCEYRFDDTITDLAQSADGVLVSFERGRPHRFDAVVGADGIHSVVRRLAFGPEARFVRRSGYRYAVAGTSPARAAGAAPERKQALLYSEPGRTVIEGGGKAPTMFVYRGDVPYDRRSPAPELQRAFRGMGWRTAELVAAAIDSELFLDEIAAVRMPRLADGRIVLLGDAGYGNTLGGFGTGLAIVGAFSLAGELAGAAPTVAFDRYDALLRRMTRDKLGMQAGAFMAPRTRAGIELRHRLWSVERFRALYVRLASRMADRTPLPAYPALSAMRAAMPSSTTDNPKSSSSL